MFDSNAVPDEAQRIKEDVLETKTRTALIYSADVFTRQARKYSQQAQCSHIALFKWDNLLLHDFPVGSKEDLEDKETRFTSVTEDSKTQQGGVEVGPIRKVLLGWLLQAIEQALGPSIHMNGHS
jgi:hypothetical protein